MREVTPELIVDGAVPLHPAISPDGRHVAWTVTPMGRAREHPAGAIWVAATDGGTPPRRLTSGAAYDVLPRWAEDPGLLFFLSDRTRRGTAQLHRIRLDGGAAEALTAWESGISGFLPPAGGRLVAVVAADEPDVEDERRRAAEGDDAIVWGERPSRARLRLLDLATGELDLVAGLGDRHVAELAQRPDGGPLAVLARPSSGLDPVADGSELWLVDLETGKATRLGRTAPEASSPVWWRADDGWHLGYLAQTPPGPVGGRAVFDLIVGEAGEHRNLTLGVGEADEHRNLTLGMDVCPTALAQVAEGPPLALFAEGLDSAMYRLDPREGRFRRMSPVAGWAGALTASRTGEAVAALVSTSYEPVNVHAGPLAGPLARLSDTRPELREVRWGVRERLSYRARDGLGLDGLVILPAGKGREDGPFPLGTLVPGGPYARHADQFTLGAIPSGQWLATAGFAVFLPNPRGGEGHGHAFASAVAGAVGQDEWADIVSGIDLLVADGVADPDRLGIGGWSHGGFMAAWAVGQTGRFKAALMGAGISDWGMLVATGEAGVLEAGLGGSCGWEGPGPHPHDRVSPISYASRVRTPVLILHGEDDTNVPVGQAVYFHRALRRFGVEHEFVVYPREGHVIRERGHQLDVLRRTRAWFARWLGPTGSG
ncbi:prolyl oligopeptidase family serine peptidase [Nonomuraea phyllanthi]|uniref:Prolyl oligopeptidase family serine peptidase n=1 Tax=Nonomuraea phyllanthi TaxID=2219224 RepID=A0A5C4WM29_9ACTN|nr:S9 family peptidase [Nonomuraea phyllanthi]KAB8194639.1 prolyl oligopeptidase family serine peptidase [Nonomuraea phyllanthi]